MDYNNLYNEVGKQYEQIIQLDSLVKPMSDDEFLDFLNKDRYGNDSPDLEAILNLLSLISSEDGYARKEKLIYMKLIDLKTKKTTL